MAIFWRAQQHKALLTNVADFTEAYYILTVYPLTRAFQLKIGDARNGAAISLCWKNERIDYGTRFQYNSCPYSNAEMVCRKLKPVKAVQIGPKMKMPMKQPCTAL